MKEFAIQLNRPPHGVYFPGMSVTGVVVAQNDKQPKSYKSINIVLNGDAYVCWSEVRYYGNTSTIVYQIGNQMLIKRALVLWDKNRDAAGGMFPLGTYHFQFSLPLTAANLPSTHSDSTSYIRYTVEATIYKEGALKGNQSVSTPITVVNKVPFALPSLLQPRSSEVRKTLCCLCCASGPIVITATLPHTGFCVGHDTIPLEVSVENSSSRSVRQLVATVTKSIYYTSSSGSVNGSSSTVASVASQEPILPHTSMVWRPDGFQIAADEPTLSNCRIITITYYLTVSASIRFAVNPTLTMHIVLGNVRTID